MVKYIKGNFLNHRRDRTSKLGKLLEELDTEPGGRATEFLMAIRADKSRYARDQFCPIHSLLDHGTPGH